MSIVIIFSIYLSGGLLCFALAEDNVTLLYAISSVSNTYEQTLYKNNPSAKTTASYSFREDIDGINKRAKSIFYVETYNADGTCLGSASGFVAFSEHLFVTNQHVIDGASYLIIWDDDQIAYKINRVLISDKESDLAILAFPEGKLYSQIDFYLNATLNRGEPVTTIGSPIGLQNTVAFGNISAMPIIDGKQKIQITAPISPGSSGGALFDDKGLLIGITSSGFTEGENIGFAISVDELDALYKLWNQTSSVELGTAYSWDTVGQKDNNSNTVYYTENGTYYHYDKTCMELLGKKPLHAASLSYAKSQGHKPCPLCVGTAVLEPTATPTADYYSTVYYSQKSTYYHVDKSCSELKGIKGLFAASSTYAQSHGYKPCPYCISSNPAK